MRMQINSRLSEEIIFEILLLLPAKSIGRCRCVSKQWRGLLSRTQFIKRHHDRIRNRKLQQQQQSLILISKSGSLSFVPLTLFDEIIVPAKKLTFADHPDSWERVIASCDGLILVSDNQDKTFLVNPVTREIRLVPPSPLALHPHACFIKDGFGYDSVNDDYKIVNLTYYHHYGKNFSDLNYRSIFFSVYSVKNDTWKQVECFRYDFNNGFLTRGVTVDGYIHWLTFKILPPYKSCVFRIIAFDLGKEKFCEVPYPSSMGNISRHYLVELGGCLGISCPLHNNEIEVWIMKEYGNKESWTKLNFIGYELAKFLPQCKLGQEQVVLMKDEKGVKYNLEKEAIKDNVVHGIFYDPFNDHAMTFIESLVSPHFSLALMHGTS